MPIHLVSPRQKRNSGSAKSLPQVQEQGVAEGEVERWLPVVGYKGRYEVSNMGRVRSLLGKSIPVRVLKHTNRPGYYPVVNLMSFSHRARSQLVHRLVLTAFVGSAPRGMECSHKNGNRRDCRLSNIEWATRKDNQAMKRLHGTNGKKLTEQRVFLIRELAKEGCLPRNIAPLFCITEGTVRAVINNKIWAYRHNLIISNRRAVKRLKKMEAA